MTCLQLSDLSELHTPDRFQKHHYNCQCTQIRVFNYNSLEKAHEFEALEIESIEVTGADMLTVEGTHGLHPLHCGPSDLAVPFVFIR